MMWGYGFGDHMWGGGFFGWIFMIFWWVLVIVAFVALVRWLSSGRCGRWRGDKTAMEILEERYARGEINKKEFEEKKRDLSG